MRVRALRRRYGYAYVPRFMRAKMRDEATANDPERIRERIAHREAGELARKAREAKYPTLTAENFTEALAYQESVLVAEKARLLAMPAPPRPRRSRR